MITDTDLSRIGELAPNIGLTATAMQLRMRFSRVKEAAVALGIPVRRGRRPSKPLQERNEAVRRARENGKFLESIGEEFGISTERVRQILKATGGDPLQKERQSQGASPVETIEASAVMPTAAAAVG